MKKLLALGLLCFSVSANAVTYNLQTLGSLSTGGDSSVRAINESGQAVGSSYNSNSGEWEAVVWNSTLVSSLGFTGTARDINDAGVIVGETGVDAYNDGVLNAGRAYKYENNVFTDLGDLNGTYSGAWGINNSGSITGISYTNYNQTGIFQLHGFVYENGVMNDLGQNAPAQYDGYSRGHAINDNGEIVGRGSEVEFAGTNTSEKHMIYWDSSHNLNFYDTVSGTYSTAQDINNNGIIAGNGRTAATGNNQYGMIWDNTGALLATLGTFGGNESRAWAINDAGIIVGYATNGDDERRAMISYDGINILDLNTVIDLTGSGFVSLDEALDINEAGQVVGIGTRADGSQGSFVMSAVPVPAAVWLFGSALGFLGWRKTRANG